MNSTVCDDAYRFDVRIIHARDVTRQLVEGHQSLMIRIYGAHPRYPGIVHVGRLNGVALRQKKDRINSE